MPSHSFLTTYSNSYALNVVHSLLTFGGVLPNINDEEGDEDNGGGVDADVDDEVGVVV